MSGYFSRLAARTGPVGGAPSVSMPEAAAEVAAPVRAAAADVDQPSAERPVLQAREQPAPPQEAPRVERPLEAEDSAPMPLAEQGDAEAPNPIAAPVERIVIERPGRTVFVEVSRLIEVAAPAQAPAPAPEPPPQTPPVMRSESRVVVRERTVLENAVAAVPKESKALAEGSLEGGAPPAEQPKQRPSGNAPKPVAVRPIEFRQAAAPTPVAAARRREASTVDVRIGSITVEVKQPVPVLAAPAPAEPTGSAAKPNGATPRLHRFYWRGW